MTEASELFAAHQETLERAVTATRTREYFSAYNESPSPRVYGETAAADGQAAFEAWLAEPLSSLGGHLHLAFDELTAGFPALR